MENWVRLTRIVDPEGLREGGGNHIKKPTGFFFTPDTVVRCAVYTIHYDPEVFPEPFLFRPEKCMSDGTDKDLKRPGMTRNSAPSGAGSRTCAGQHHALRYSSGFGR